MQQTEKVLPEEEKEKVIPQEEALPKPEDPKVDQTKVLPEEETKKVLPEGETEKFPDQTAGTKEIEKEAEKVIQDTQKPDQEKDHLQETMEL